MAKMQVTDVHQCTLDTCDMAFAQIRYRPSLPGNIVVVALFVICFFAHLIYSFRHKTWGFSIAFMLGLATEIIGYIGRLMLYQNPFSHNAFLIYLVCVTIAPAFMSAGLYLCLGRIIGVYGTHTARFRPGVYTIVFCTCDFLALLLQAVGGAIASTSTLDPDVHRGINIMIAGVSSQVACLLLFIILCIDYFLRIHRYSDALNNSPSHLSLYTSRIWKYFLSALAVSTIAIFIRSVFRVAELSEGFKGNLANDQVTYMVLEAAMIVIAAGALTILAPGYVFGDVWHQANFKFRTEKGGESSGSSEVELK